MISRRSTMKIAEYLYDNFTKSKRVNYGSFGRNNYKWERSVKKEQFKEFLYLSGVHPFTYNKMSIVYDADRLKDYVLNMETGMFYHKIEYMKHRNIGQEDLKKLALAILNRQGTDYSQFDLYNSLLLDGYELRDNKLYKVNSDMKEEVSLLKKLYTKYKLPCSEEFIKFYDDMVEHFSNGKWEDSIHNGRKVLEIVLRSSAIIYQNSISDNNITEQSKPVKVREYLEKIGFFSDKEIMLIKDYYGYISNIGSHPKLARETQANFTRILTINISLYVLNRLGEMLK